MTPNNSHSSSVQSLYVHVPFCATKCEYCAFYSEASSGEQMNRYVDALIREMELVASSVKPRTVFFGGGTPSILSLQQWQRILTAMERLDLLGADEWTIECNPATVSTDKASLFRQYGVNRISMGVQSLDADLLVRLGRIHSREMVFKSFDRLRGAGFENINIDLMFAIPGQTMETWQSTMDEAIALGSEHLSCYEVIYEEDTPLYEQLQAGEFDIDEALACAMYDRLIDTAAAAGFSQYEVANFARHEGEPDPELPSRACRHNINYWRGGACQALGPSASGFVDGRRIRNVANTERYCEQLELGQRAHESVEQLPPGQCRRDSGVWPADERRLAVRLVHASHRARPPQRVGGGHAARGRCRLGCTGSGALSPHPRGSPLRRHHSRVVYPAGGITI